jgi:hypothetical protein
MCQVWALTAHSERPARYVRCSTAVRSDKPQGEAVTTDSTPDSDKRAAQHSGAVDISPERHRRKSTVDPELSPDEQT